MRGQAPRIRAAGPGQAIDHQSPAKVYVIYKDVCDGAQTEQVI